MARIRSIKPEFWKSDAIARLSWEARLAFVALWSYVDDNGVGRDNVKLITAELFALEDDPTESIARVSRILDELARESRIVRYTHAGKGYLFVNNWDEHQKIDRPTKTRYPRPDAEGSTPLTCANTDPREEVAEHSRVARESPSPGAVELGTKGTGSRGTGEQGVPPQNSDGALAIRTPASHPGTIVRAESVNQRANRLTKAYTDRVPLSRFPAVAGIVKRAIAADKTDDEITSALLRLAAEGRSVTVETLRVEIEGLPPPARGGSAKKREGDRILLEAWEATA